MDQPQNIYAGLKKKKPDQVENMYDTMCTHTHTHTQFTRKVIYPDRK